MRKDDSKRKKAERASERRDKAFGSAEAAGQRRDQVFLPAEAAEQRRDKLCRVAEDADEELGALRPEKEGGDQEQGKTGHASVTSDRRRDKVCLLAEAAERRGDNVCPGAEAADRRRDNVCPAAEAVEQKADVVPIISKGANGEELNWWQKTVLQFPANQFVISKKFKNVEEAVRSGPGILHLFSGARGISRACAATFDVWCLTFDLKHHPSEDLSNLSLQGKLARLIRSGAFSAMVAGPVCASFSTAITPPCRTSAYPAGVPWCSEKQKLKNQIGNAQLLFVLRLVRCCLASGTRFAVENPNGSWMWKQVGSASWEDILAWPGVGDLKVDYCMFGCPWQKRTRFRTDLQLKDQKLFCTAGLKHVRLRGRCRERGVNFTQLAEPYPRPLCYALAASIGIDCGFLGGLRRKLDIASCARGSHARIGEAKNPGPRKGRGPREGDLTEVELLEPATIAMRARIWQSFVSWVDDNVGPGVFPWVLNQPATLIGGSANQLWAFSF